MGDPSASRPPRITNRLRFKVIASVIVLGVLLFIGFIFGVMPTIERNLRAYETSRAELYAALVARAYGRTAEAAIGELEGLAALPAITTMEKASIDPILKSFDATTSDFVHYSVFDLTGRVVSRPDKPSRIGADRSSDVHVSGPLRTGRTVVGPVRVSPGGNLALTIGTPIRRDGAMIGVLSGSLGLPDRNPDHFSEILDPPLPPAWRIWLVSAEGVLIAHSGDSPTSDSGVVDATSHPSVARALTNPRGPFEFEADGRRWIAASSQIEPLGWHVIAEVPEEVIANAVATTARRPTIVGLAAIAALIAFTWLLASRLTARLKRLSAALAGYGAGVATPMDPGGTDEIGDALVAFNQMIVERRRAEEERDQLAQQSERYLLERLEERTQRLQASQEALRSREQFISVAAHELNTPLTSLQLMLEGLRRGVVGGKPEQLQRAVEVAERQGRKLAALVDMLLGVGRSMSGHALTLQRESIDLAVVAREAVELLARDLQRSGSTVSIHTNGPVLGRWDRRRIEQVFTNLLGNAIKFGKGMPIDVTITQRGDSARLVVADHGIGISEEHLPKIFERFERGVSSSHYGGLGLGLAIVREIVMAHGGTVQVDSTLGSGAVFTIDLPCDAPPVEEIASSEPHRQPEGERT